MRRERVAAVDPFAPAPPAPQTQTTRGSASTTTSTNNQQQQQQPTSSVPSTTGFATSAATNNLFSSSFTTATSSSSSSSSTLPIFFDPFFKKSSKSHQHHKPNNNNNNNNINSNAAVVVQAKSNIDNSNNNNNNNNLAGSSIASTLTSLFDQDANLHAKMKKDEADEKWKIENEGKLLTAAQIVQSWKEECAVDVLDKNMATTSSVVSFVGQRKAAVGIPLDNNKQQRNENDQNNNVNLEIKKEEEVAQQSEDSAIPSTQIPIATTTAATTTVIAASAGLPFSGLFDASGIPEVEWWDRRFLSAASYALGPTKQLPLLGGIGAVNGFDSTITSLAMKKATASVYDHTNNQIQNNTHHQDSSNFSSPVLPCATVCALPKKIGWNPGDSGDRVGDEKVTDANQHVEKMKTVEEIAKERHARRLAAASHKQEELRQARADQHNFGLQRSIQIEGQEPQSQKPLEASNPILLHDKIKMKHLETILLQDVMLNPSIKDEVIDQIQARMRKHLEDNNRRHADAKTHQVDHAYEVDKRQATTFPRLIVVRCLGITDVNTLQRFKIICKQDLLLRGTFVWIKKRFLIAVLVGGESAIRSAEQTFLERFKGKENILREGSNIDVVWGGTISDFAFSRSFLIENSPFERDGRHKKPESFVKKETEMKRQQQQQASSSSLMPSNVVQNNNASTTIDEREYRRKYESIAVLEVNSMLDAKVWFSRNNFDFLWDVVVKTPVEVEENLY